MWRYSDEGLSVKRTYVRGGRKRRATDKARKEEEEEEEKRGTGFLAFKRWEEEQHQDRRSEGGDRYQHNLVPRMMVCICQIFLQLPIREDGISSKDRGEEEEEGGEIFLGCLCFFFLFFFWGGRILLTLCIPLTTYFLTQCSVLGPDCFLCVIRASNTIWFCHTRVLPGGSFSDAHFF